MWIILFFLKTFEIGQLNINAPFGAVPKSALTGKKIRTKIIENLPIFFVLQ